MKQHVKDVMHRALKDSSDGQMQKGKRKRDISQVECDQRKELEQYQRTHVLKEAN